jgi:type IV secretion system protein VirB5
MELQRLINTNAILNSDQVAGLSIAERSQLEAARRSAALLQALTREALSTTSRRFQSIQQLINAISRAEDQKAILDLQARIQAEQSMLQNEGTKLGILYQTAQAEEWARKQRVREQAINSIGSLRDLPPLGL